MKILLTLAASALICGTLMQRADAHHSAAQFDFAHTVTIQGTVKSFRVVNPHTRAVVEVTDPKKGTREVEYEGHSASNFFRSGFIRDEVLPGTKISILIAPRRDGDDGGFILAFTTANGHTVGFGGLSPSTGKSEEPTAAK